jgi:hypothetical protein
VTTFRRILSFKGLADESSAFSTENIEFLTRLNKNLAKRKKDKRKKRNLCIEEGKTVEFSELITWFSLTSPLLRLYFFQKNEKGGGGGRRQRSRRIERYTPGLRATNLRIKTLP